MNDGDLADALAADHGISKADARNMWMPSSPPSSILPARAEMSLSGFGKFKVKQRPRGPQPRDR